MSTIRYATGEGCKDEGGAGARLACVPQWAYLRSFRCFQDPEQNSWAVLLEGDGWRCQGACKLLFAYSSYHAWRYPAIGESLPSLPTHEQKDRGWKTGDVSCGSEIPMAPTWNGFCGTDISSLPGRQQIYPHCFRLFLKVRMGKGTAIKGSCSCCFCSAGGENNILTN